MASKILMCKIAVIMYALSVSVSQNARQQESLMSDD
jgi:hypothetical protein